MAGQEIIRYALQNPPGRVRKKSTGQGGKSCKKIPASRRSTGLHYLNYRFKSIPGYQGIDDPVFNSCNYDYVYDTVKNYSTLLGSSFHFQSEQRDLNDLWDYMDSILPVGQYSYLEGDGSAIRMFIQYGKNPLLDSLYFIPVKILHCTGGMFREILLTFFRILNQQLELIPFYHLYDYEIIVEEYNEWQEEENPYMESYQQGDIYSLMMEVCSFHGFIPLLKDLLHSYKPHIKSYEQKLIHLIEYGILLMEQEDNLWDELVRTEQNTCHREEEIDISRKVRFLYDIDDEVAEQIREYLVSEVQEMEANHSYIRSSQMEVTPSTTTLFRDTYANEFFGWLNELIYNLNQYTDS